MKTALRLYRGDDVREETDAAAEAAADVATADPAAPRVLPFPRYVDGGDAPADRSETRFVDGGDGAVTLRFDAAHAPAGADRVPADEVPDVLPLSAILSPPRFRDGSAPADAAPAGAVAGRIGVAPAACDGGWARSPRGLADGPLSRAKALHANRTCTACGAGGVEPVLLSDGVRDGSGQQVPGSGTLVGFHCGRCEHEWPVA